MRQLPRFQFFQVHRACKVKTLRHVDIGVVGQISQLLRCFDTFRDNRHAEVFTECLDCAYDILILGVFINLRNEAAVDLYFVRGYLCENAER